jgi:mannosyltransferase OCH1-like enzyme
MTESESLINGYKIPNIIHQTFISTKLPIEIINIIINNKKICPNCEFRFYDDNDCDIFIKNNFEEKIYNAYKSINDVYGAMKADFFRYCVLYKIGGIYLDIKSIIKMPIFKILNKDDTCVLDIPRNNLEPWRTNSPTYEQWLLIFAPNHPYLLEMINTIVNYIEIKYEPKINNNKIINTKQKILFITGPDSFTQVINKYIKKNNNQCLHRCIDYDKFSKINILGSRYKNMYTAHNKKHYSQYTESLYK